MSSTADIAASSASPVSGPFIGFGTAAVALGVLTIVAVVAASQLSIAAGVDKFGESFARTLPLQIGQWWSWAVVALAVRALARWFPLERRRLIVSIPVHTLASVLFAALHILLLAVLYKAVYPELRNESLLGLAGRFVLGYHAEALVYWAILAVVCALDYQRSLREHAMKASQLEAQLAAARLEALRAQLQPHFLFNALHGIAGLVREDEKTAAVRMIAGLGDLLRLALASSEKSEVTLAEELEFVERYLEIQAMRFSDSLHVEFAVEPDTLHALVPNLILQPLVENAIRHGTSNQPGGGRVTVSAQRDGDRLVLKVSDTGPGFQDGTPESGIGLRNTRARLATLYSGASDLALRNLARGAEAVVSIPYRCASVDAS